MPWTLARSTLFFLAAFLAWGVAMMVLVQEYPQSVPRWFVLRCTVVCTGAAPPLVYETHDAVLDVSSQLRTPVPHACAISVPDSSS